jgi:hypothetical protein
MPSTYTTGGVELIATGEKSGTWGTITNDNFQILERLAQGVGTIALDSGTSSHTLTTTNGALSDGQYKALVFTGGFTTAANTVTLSSVDQQRVYLVLNSTGNSQNLIIAQGTGTTVTIADGKSAIIYCDGTGAGANVVDITSTLDNFGTMSTQDKTSVDITGGSISGITDLAVADGGTGASTASDALINLGLDATAAEINVLDGYTGDVNDLNTTDVTTLGTSEASKCVTADANGDVYVAEEFKAKSYNETYSSVGSSSGTTTFNLETGNVFATTLSENTTLAFSNPPATDTAYSFTLKIVQDASGSGFTVSYPAAVVWSGAAAPLLTTSANAVDILVFFTHDNGTTWYGFVAGYDMS